MGLNMLRIAVLASGGGTNLQAIINAIESGELNAVIACVCVSNAKAYAINRAKNHNISYKIFAKKDFESSIQRDLIMANYIEEKGANLVACCGSLMILSPDFIAKFPKKIINIHPSLLPSFGGKGFFGIKVHEAVLNAKVQTTGATVHFVDTGVDTGEILLQKSVPVLENDTPEILQQRVMELAEAPLLIQALKMFEGV